MVIAQMATSSRFTSTYERACSMNARLACRHVMPFRWWWWTGEHA
jgi:hypothetical protein